MTTAFERIINKPTRASARQRFKCCMRSPAPRATLFASALDVLSTDELRPQAKRTLATIIDDFERWRRLSEAAHHTELAETILDESGYTEMWQARLKKQADAAGRLENLKELISAMEEFDCWPDS